MLRTPDSSGLEEDGSKRHMIKIGQSLEMDGLERKKKVEFKDVTEQIIYGLCNIHM